MKESKKAKKSPGRDSLTTGRAAAHCQVTAPTLKTWIRDGRLHVFKTPGGHARIAVDEFQRFLREHGMPALPAGAPAGTDILVADDEPLVLDMLVDVIIGHPRGFKVETATDGYEALIKVGSFKPSLLILDVMMPKLDGIAVCRHLKANVDTRGIKILGVTGYPDAVPALLAAGADACLTKPLLLQDVEREIDRLMSEG